MSARTLDEADRTLKHVWSEPKARVAFEAPFDFAAALRGEPGETIDPDWWEPRHDQPWRRQVARDREEFGGAYVAGPKPPVEGPNNPNRLRRELERDARWLAEYEAQESEIERDMLATRERIAWLKQRLGAA